MTIKQRLRKRQVRDKNFKCFYCNIKLTDKTVTLDHLIPSSKGGPNTESNLVLACTWCNSTKDDKTYDEMDITSIARYSAYKRMMDSLRSQSRLERSFRKYYLT